MTLEFFWRAINPVCAGEIFYDAIVVGSETLIRRWGSREPFFRACLPRMHVRVLMHTPTTRTHCNAMMQQQQLLGLESLDWPEYPRKSNRSFARSFIHFCFISHSLPFRLILDTHNYSRTVSLYLYYFSNLS